MRKKIDPKKGITPKVAQIAQNWCFLFCRWRYLKIMRTVQIWKPNGWKLLYLGPPAHFGAQKCPKRGPFTERNWKFAHCHIFDLIMQHIPGKLQMSCTCGSKVMRPPSCNPKKVIAPKWEQIGPKLVFSCFPGGDNHKSWAQTKFEAERLNIALFRTDRTFWDPKLPHSHRPT